MFILRTNRMNKRLQTIWITLCAVLVLTFPGCGGGGGGGGTTQPTTKYTITPSAGTGGVISPSSIQTVTSGSNVSFTITPDSGYHVADVLVDGNSFGALTSYTFSNVTMNHTIRVNFAITPTTMVLTMSTQGTLADGIQIGGIDITVSLASGVWAKSTSNPPQTDAGVVVASGMASSNSQLLATYTPPSGSTHGSARLLIINANGFGIGEFATVTGDIAAGYNPTSADFSVTSLAVTDLNGAPIIGLTVAFAVSNQ